MEVLKFKLSGKTAFFKKPDVNTYFYFTYGNIHKIALLGILGAIMGFKGYNQQQDDEFPEFYQKFRDIKLGIVPKNSNGYIPKKVQVYNNSVGYASKEQGGNLIVKEQWLETPEWDIYFIVQSEVEQELAKRIMNLNFRYLPYLGKNDHIADITEAKIINNCERIPQVNKINSLFIKDYFQLVHNEYDLFDDDTEYTQTFKYQEMLPAALEETTNKYNLKTFVYTNSKLEPQKDGLIYNCDGKTIFFF